MYGAASLKKKWSVLVPMVSSMNSLFSSLFLVRWCGRLVGEDLVEDYNAFRVERRGVSRRRQTIKWGLWGIDCQFTTKEEGGGEIMKISRGLMRGSSKFYHDTTDILNPTTHRATVVLKWKWISRP